jgi:hypothetical protein
MANCFLLPAAKGKRAIAWWLALFACSQLVLAVYLYRRHPELKDPVYGSRILSLRKRLAEQPGRPLVLILGSSRAMNSIAPAAIPPFSDSSGQAPLVYNFAISGSGPVRMQMTFRRLLADGVRPDRLLVETWPPLWPQHGSFDERDSLDQDDLRWTDVPTLVRYLPNQGEILSRVARNSLTPLICYRSRLLYVAAQSLLPRHQAWQIANEMHNWHSFDDTGWLPALNIPVTPEEKRREVERGQVMAKPLLNPLRIHPSSEGALRDLLHDCKSRGIQVALMLLPEHSACRRWYSPQSHELVRAYLGSVSRDYRIPVFDLRDWMSDDAFADFCHMAPQAAAPFSERFGREVLQPWLEGQPLRRDLLLRDGDR